MGVSRQPKNGADVITIQASGAVTETGTGSAVKLPPYVNAIVFTADLTAAATDADDTLDLTVQTKLDGTNWVDVVHFTQMLGNGGAKTYVAKIVADIAQAEFETGTALSAAAIRHLFGDEWRASWTIVDPTGSNVSFTFSVTAMPM